MDWINLIAGAIVNIPCGIISAYLYDRYVVKKLKDPSPTLVISTPKEASTQQTAKTRPTIKGEPDYRSRNRAQLKRVLLNYFFLAFCAYALWLAFYIPIVLFGGQSNGLELSRLRFMGAYLPGIVIPGDFVVAGTIIYALMFFVPLLKLADGLLFKIKSLFEKFWEMDLGTWLKFRFSIFTGFCILASTLIVFMLTTYSLWMSFVTVLIIIAFGMGLGSSKDKTK